MVKIKKKTTNCMRKGNIHDNMYEKELLFIIN